MKPTRTDLTGIRRPASRQGFTLVELVGVLIIVGILALVAVPRFFSASTFEYRAWYDQAAAMLRFARTYAIAQGAPVYVRLNGNSIALCLDPACTRTLTAPAGQNSGRPATLAACGSNSAWYCEAVPTGISYVSTSDAGVSYNNAAARFYFDGLGKPFNTGDVPPNSGFNSRLVITISGDGSTRHIYVEQETGYVHL